MALLAAAGNRGVGRERILGLLWPESDPERARKSLAQAVYALRREFGAEDVVVGSTELRLGWEGFTSDVADFRAAMGARQYQEAVSLYHGPFLDGVHIDEAPEFERWAETERASLAQDYIGALERLAVEADRQRDYRTAVAWWRKLANADPLNGQIAHSLMRALAAQGDRGAALQHYRVYEMLLRQELELSPDPDLRALADELRRAPEVGRLTTPPGGTTPTSPMGPPPVAYPVSSPPAVPVTTVPRTPAVVRPLEPAAPGAPPRAPTRDRHGISGKTDEYARPRPFGTETPPDLLRTGAQLPRKPLLARTSTRYGIAIGLLLGLILAGVVRVRLSVDRPRGGPATPIVAVGLIRDYTRGREELGRPLADMLATSLARSEGLQVISTARMYELIAHDVAGRDSLAAVMGAARSAGAAELIDGTLLDSAGTLRLDLRRTDLATGSLRRTYRAQGQDLFALVESGTRQLLSEMGIRPPTGEFADATTRSLLAYRLYEQGLRAVFSGETESARRLLRDALAEDSTFAMAAYWLAWEETPVDIKLLERAVRLSANATERERLTILAGWMNYTDDPARTAVAESLVTRFPNEPEGYLWLGRALRWGGDFTGAVIPFRHLVAMDSASLRRAPRTGQRCFACDGLSELVSLYTAMDSFPAAERVARQWTRQQPGNPNAWANLATVLGFVGRYQEALAATQTLAALTPGVSHEGFKALMNLRAGSFPEADRHFQQEARGNDTTFRAEALKWLSISLRMQGRAQEALAPAREMRAMDPDARRRPTPYNSLFEAQVWFDRGDYRRAAAVFDSISRAPKFNVPAQIARNLVWTQTLRATALAAAGDTLLLATLADSVERWGTRSAYGRDRLLHHHIRGLLLTARGDLERAASEFRQAIYSPTYGYTRTNLELGKVLLRLGRPKEAVAWAEVALRGPMEAANTYLTLTELQELSAAAYDAAGMKDSALVRYRQVVSNWAHADPAYAPRVERARLRIAALSGQ